MDQSRDGMEASGRAYRTFIPATHLHDILYLQVPVLRKKVHCCSPGRRGYDCCWVDIDWARFV